MRGFARASGIWLVPCLFLAACDSGGPGASEEAAGLKPGRLVIIGGGLQAETVEVYQAILDGREGEGPLCVFPTASAEPQESMESAIGRFDAVGGSGSAEGIWLTVDNPEAASDSATVEQIRGCSGFYFAGGQQSRIVRVLRPDEGDTPAYAALMERYLAGAVVSGSSAGAAIMSDPMIGGGQSAAALNEGIRTGDDGDGVRIQKGLGFFEAGMVDQHFLARGRWARLLVALFAEEAFDLGFGIDENTALVVDGADVWVAGGSGVIFFDTRGAEPDREGNAGSAVVLHLLGAGDRVSLETGEVSVEPQKPALDGTGEPFSGSDIDLFERWALLNFLAQSAVAEDLSFGFQQDGHSFEFEKGPGFAAHAWYGLGVQDTPLGLSVGPYLLRVRRNPSN